MDIVIKQGTVVTASDVFKADVGIQDGRVAEIASQINGGAKIINASGKYVVPGGVEIHTHIDGVLHGMRTVDDWYDVSVGAAFGGTTTVVDYPLQGEEQTLWETVCEFKERAEGNSIVDFAFSPSVTKFTDETLAEIPKLIEDGITSYKVFMYYDWQIDDYNLARFLDTIGGRGGLVSIHCENAGTIDYLVDQCLEAGKTGPEWHVQTRPVSTEVEAVSRVLSVAGELDAPVLIVHISAGPVAVELATARARGVPAYGETTPHFLCLDDSVYEDPAMRMNFIMTPPLRPKDHQEALWRGLRTGAIATVGSDHCAFPRKDKIRLYETRGSTFTMIPHGLPGIETRVPLMFSEGVSKGRISLSKFVEVTATNPARLAGIYPRKGTIAVGSDADITIIDPKKEVKLSNRMLHGNTDYTPFEGWKLKGYPVTTISRGEMLVEEGELVGERGHGEFLAKRNCFVPF